MGAVTPVGNDVSAFWESLKTGKCGIGPITKFDTAEYKTKVAAEIKDFDPLLYMEKSDVRKYDLFCQYALAAATQAVEESGIRGTLPPERIGTYFGSGIGGINTFAQGNRFCYVPNAARKAEVELALSASLGFGGHNAYLAFRNAD